MEKRIPGRPKKRYEDQIIADPKPSLAIAKKVMTENDDWKNLTRMGRARILRTLCI